MSNICLFNLHHNLTYDKLNDLANRLVRISLNNNIGIIFNAQEYAESITREKKFKTFFVISDSFLHYNSEFLDMPINYNLCEIEQCKRDFTNNYVFLYNIICELLQAHISKIDIYLSSDGAVSSLTDFVYKKTTATSFLSDLFETILDSAKEYAYCIPSVCYTIDSK